MKITYIIVSCMCLMFASALISAKGRSVPVASAPDEPFDSYGDISWEEEKAHLDNFAIALQHDPKLIGYIIVYAGQRACVGEAEDRARRAKKYLVETRGVQESRVKWIDGGYREKPTVILQPVPPDAAELTASPTVKPTDGMPRHTKKSMALSLIWVRSVLAGTRIQCCARHLDTAEPYSTEPHAN